MLKKTISYVDFNDEDVTETLYFNLSAKEIFEMMGIETDEKGDPIGSSFQEAAKSGKLNEVLSKLSDLVLNSYGVRSEDGKRFIKTPQMKEEFAQTQAYATIFEELMLEDDKALMEFVKAVLPKKLADQLKTVEVAPTS